MIFDLVPNDHEREAFEDLLARRIEDMLRNDFPTLIQALYRVDVPEVEVARAFQAETLAQTARLLARAVVERQLQKIASRKKYSVPDANRFCEPNENPPDDAAGLPS
ncbi:MAG: hypothetical protein RMM53_02400 [Bacteroidia bacterium]|nr:hypothetical protein [Bacteroidia bacterium]MDW8333046.1 hypothetical protein [Bacteroidia bacterium]